MDRYILSSAILHLVRWAMCSYTGLTNEGVNYAIFMVYFQLELPYEMSNEGPRCFYTVSLSCWWASLWIILWCLWWPRYIIVVRFSRCPQIATIQWYLVILHRLRCFMTGLSSSDGFYDDLAIFKVNLVEVWLIYIPKHDLSIYLRV